MIVEHQFDYLENEFEPLNDKVLIFHKELCHKYQESEFLLVAQLIEKDLVQKPLHDHLNNNNFTKYVFFSSVDVFELHTNRFKCL